MFPGQPGRSSRGPTPGRSRSTTRPLRTRTSRGGRSSRRTRRSLTLTSDPWDNPSTDTRELWCWEEGDASDCDRVVGNLASRGPWDFNFKANAATNTTIGNNANAATSWTHPFLPSPPQFRPVSPRGTTCSRGRTTGSGGTASRLRARPAQTWDDSAATVNLFVMHNRMHDFAYFLGFTERNWNAQDFNFGLTETFRENDPLLGNVQSGVLAGRGTTRT